MKKINNRLKLYACLPSRQLLYDLDIDDLGLTNEQVVKMRHLYGKNEIVSKKHDSILYCVRRSFINPFTVILFVLGTISLFVDLYLTDRYQVNMTSVFIIFSMIILSSVIRLVQEFHSLCVTHELLKLVHVSTKVWRNHQWEDISSSKIVVGDYVEIKAGDRVPADLRLIEATDLFVLQSVVTGESGILEKNANILLEQPSQLIDYQNIVFGGSTVIGGCGKGIVLSVGKDTVYGSLGYDGKKRKDGFHDGATSIAKVLIRFMLILIPIVFVVSGLTKGNWLEAFLYALSVAVGLTPELLPMVVNACLVKGSHSMRQKQTIVKNVNAMQSFGSMDVLCVDKTGTLTGDQLVLEYYMDILGNESQKVLDYAYLASYYHTGVENPLDQAIRKIGKIEPKHDHYDQCIHQYSKIDEVPFDYNKKISSVLVENHQGRYVILKGSINEVVSLCQWVEYKEEIVPIDKQALQYVHEIVDEMLDDGMKVIAIAYQKTDDLKISLDQHFILLGYLAFFDAPKKSASSALAKLQHLHIQSKVLTGDQKSVTLSICKRLNMDVDSYITGSQLEQLAYNKLPIAIEKNHIFVELTPQQKAMIIKVLQDNGHSVGFLGDGMNDLPAILQADVGISVENATESVKESADVILLKKDLNTLEEGVLEGRKAFMNMSKYIKITASSNFGNIVSIMIASIFLPFFPMTSVQLLLLNLLYDILCLVLPWDNVDEDVMLLPLQWSGKTLSKFMTFFGPISSIFDVLTFAFLYFVLCPWLIGGSFSTLSPSYQSLFISLFQTGWFLESLWTQVLILQLLRTPYFPFLESRPSKPVLLMTLFGLFLFTLLPITGLGSMLKMTMMPMIYFIYLIVCVMGYLFIVTFVKFIYIRKHNHLI